MADINIYGKLVNATPEGVLADSEQIKDTVQNKKQSEINSEVKSKLEELESRPEGVSEYSELTGKPQIGGIELVGNKSLSDLGIQAVGDYATKSELGNKLDTSTYNSDKETFATKTELEGKVDDSEISDMLTKTEASSTYATKTELGNKLDTSTYNSDKETFATKSELEGKVDDSEISDMLTKTEASSTYQPKGDYLTSVPEEYVTETELSNKNYSTKEELNSKQDTLISGTNIKSINNISILGEGNVDISPTIGENGNWYINGEDTGKPSQGESGVSLGEVSLVQELGTDTGSENKVMSQKAVSLAVEGVAKCVPISNVTDIL